MAIKNIKIGYFSLPAKTKKEFQETWLFLDENDKIKVGDLPGREITPSQFIRSLARGDITLTKEGEKFTKEAIKKGRM